VWACATGYNSLWLNKEPQDERGRNEHNQEEVESDRTVRSRFGGSVAGKNHPEGKGDGSRGNKARNTAQSEFLKKANWHFFGRKKTVPANLRPKRKQD